MKWFGLDKYYEIIFSVALFIVLDAGVLALNYYNSYRISDDAHAIQLASRQATLSQQILHQLYQVRDDLDAERSIDQSLSFLSKSFSQFDEILDSFIYGGTLIGRDQGQDDLLLGNDYSFVGTKLLDDINLLWQPYRLAISPVIYSSYNTQLNHDELINRVNSAITLGVNSNKDLLNSLNEFTYAIEGKASHKAEKIRIIQAVGITLALINFVLILFHFIRKLRHSDRQVESAQQETNEILTTINDGLFLLDREYHIGSQHSTSLVKLLGQNELAGKDFLTLLKSLVSEDTLKIAQEYLDMMFSSHVNPDLMSDLNPLDCVEIHFPARDGGFDIRYFAFQFIPVKKSEQLVHLLATVNDMTERVILKNELEKAKNESAHILEQLMTVIHINDDVFQQFSDSMTSSLTEINTLLRKPVNKQEQYKEKLHTIARIAHKVKGDAGLVGIETIQASIHNFEALIDIIHKKNNISGNDFLPLTIQLNELHEQLSMLHKLIDNSSFIREALDSPSKTHSGDTSDSYKQKVVKEEVDKADMFDEAISIDKKNDKTYTNNSIDEWKNSMASMVENISLKYNKKVEIDINDLNINDVPGNHQEDVKSVIIQFVKNALIHGIENSASRTAIGKSAIGNIRIFTQKTTSGVAVVVRDDGRGIDLDSIRQKLIHKHNHSPDKVASLSSSQLIGYMFRSGFSTANDVTYDAGRGVGLSVVKNFSNKCNGKLSVIYDVKKFTEFKVFIPLKIQQATA